MKITKNDNNALEACHIPAHTHVKRDGILYALIQSPIFKSLQN